MIDLACARGGVPVLAGLSFDLPAGEAVLVRGPNGSGKTTLLRTLAGLQPPLAGEILGAPDSVAYAGHADGVKATLTVAENLLFWAAVFGTMRIDAALDAFDLRELAGRQGQHLSAGQRRRLGLARLLLTGRPIWVLDEPTVSLDTASVALFETAILRHLAQGGAALIATHLDLNLPGRVLDLTRHRARLPAGTGFDEAFL